MSTRPRRLLLGLTLVAGAAGCAESDHRSPLSVPLPGEIGDGFSSTARVIPPLVRAESPPPPIGASTLAIDGRRALVSDSDRDRVLLVDLDTRALVTTWSFPGAEPGRLAFAPDGDHAWVVLRQGGELARLDLGGGVDHRWSPCPSPRGVAVAPDGAVHVACLGGLLVSADADGRETARRRLAPDLRDVIVADDGALWISRLRSAELYRIDARGEPRLVSLDEHASIGRGELRGFRPSVAWRLRPAPDGGALVVHQLAGKGEVEVDTPSGYGGFGGCSPGIVATGVSRVDPDGEVVEAVVTAQAVLAVDGVARPDGLTLAAPGNRGLRTTAPTISRSGGCDGVDGDDGRQVVAVELDDRGDLWRFSREPAELVGPDETVITLGGPSVFDTGHDLFHVDAGAGIACASCHPEGGEDGQIWTFSDTGPRRTQPLHGGLKGSEPFHWAGDLGDFGALAGEVFARRMGGPMVPRAYIGAWLDWIETVPMPIADLGADPIAAERGRILFEDPTVGCATCHSGDRLADRGTWDVGTGGALQTPTLRNIALRGPFMHDGCAPGLVDRFGACGGGDDHGRVSGLDRAAITDLVAYLQTL
ncbi:MAG: cytochrome-c peroxidase [bacterium]